MRGFQPQILKLKEKSYFSEHSPHQIFLAIQRSLEAISQLQGHLQGYLLGLQ